MLDGGKPFLQVCEDPCEGGGLHGQGIGILKETPQRAVPYAVRDVAQGVQRQGMSRAAGFTACAVQVRPGAREVPDHPVSDCAHSPMDQEAASSRPQTLAALSMWDMISPGVRRENLVHLYTGQKRRLFHGQFLLTRSMIEPASPMAPWGHCPWRNRRMNKKDSSRRQQNSAGHMPMRALTFFFCSSVEK